MVKQKKQLNPKKSSQKVTFLRGGKKITLYKSPNLIAVRLCSGAVLEKLPGRLVRDLKLPATVRFVQKYPGRRIGVFHCQENNRDDIMDKLRTKKDLVQYCSHVLQRSITEHIPGTEIGLDNKLFVEFPTPPNRKSIKEIEQNHNLRMIWRFPEMPQGAVFELTEKATINPIKICEELLKDKRLLCAEPCLIEAKVGKAIPHDPGFSKQWHLLNTGQGGGVPGGDCNATEAWDYTWGNPDITVAVIDDGFDLKHPDFSQPGKIVAPYDASHHDTDPRPEGFEDNHGTSCAGVAIASRGGGISLGVAPDCSFMPIRHAGRLGDYDEALAFYYAYKNNADVISCSWGPPDAYVNSFWALPMLTQYVIDICVRNGRQGKGIPIFFAAGNGNEPIELDGYASYDNVIAVAACTNENEKASYSDYGKHVWVTAPSSGGTQGIFTVDRIGIEGYSWYSDYTDDFGGTSSATPLAAGIAALMLSVNPELTISQVRNILKETAVKINKENPRNYQDTWGNNYSDTYNEDGHSLVYGWGRIDAGAAVAEAINLKNQ